VDDAMTPESETASLAQKEEHAGKHAADVFFARGQE